MNITVVTLGSRGDVQPYVALGRALLARGHHVRLVSGDNFRPLVEAYGLAFAPLGVDIEAFMVAQAAIADSGRNTFAALRRVMSASGPLLRQVFEATEAACAGADLLIGNLLGIAAYSMAEKLGVPFLYASTVPLPGNTRTQPSLAIPVRCSLGGPLNLTTHRAFTAFLWQMLRPQMNGWRIRLGLQPLHRLGWPFGRLNGQPVPALFGISPTVMPRPIDWPEHWKLTGYWFLDSPDDWSPPADLLRFLEAGPPPVYIGFGSMTTRTPEVRAAMVVEAARRAGVRTVIAAGWGTLAAEASDTVYALREVPHSWLFPRMAAVVHHGGAGTTAAGLRAGRPTIIVPHFGDQPFWGARVETLGVGPAPIPAKALTAQRLAVAVRAAVEDPGLRDRAAKVGALLRAEMGTLTAAKLVEQAAR